MNPQLLLALGGIGLFLLGMSLMTDALREAAGAGIRRILARFTTTPYHGVVTGTGITALLQSSSATTVMTVGFVGAGLLSFQQSLGILYGANIGTTVTGWMVLLVGFKLQLGALALGLLFPASLGMLLGHGRIARLSQMLAGFSLIFIGIDMMQDGMRDAAEMLARLPIPSDGIAGLLAMAVLGMVVTVAMQSSSAAIALVLVLAADDDGLTLGPATAAIIGMNLGTTFTALLAALGGGRAMMQTALANLLFRVGCVALVLPLLALWGGSYAQMAEATGLQTALVIFHTGFNVIGAIVFLPLTARFAALVRRIVPDPAASQPPQLDPALLSDPQAAMAAARSSLHWSARACHRALARALADPPDLRAVSALEPRVRPVLEDVTDWLSRISLPRGQQRPAEAFSALLHHLDHMQRLLDRTVRAGGAGALAADPQMVRATRWLAAALGDDRGQGPAGLSRRLRRMSPALRRRIRRRRADVLKTPPATAGTGATVFEITDAMRWFDRVLHHLAQIDHYDRLSAEALGLTPPPATDAAPAPEPRHSRQP